MSIKINTNSSTASINSSKKIKSSVDGAPVQKKETALVINDRAEISDEAKKLQEKQSMIERLREELENSNKTTEAMSESYSDYGKALEICRRIMNGDNVPPQDEKFLMEYDPEMYMKAKSLQLINRSKDSKDHDSLIDDEDSDNSKINGMSAPSSDSAAASDAGGEPTPAPSSESAL